MFVHVLNVLCFFIDDLSCVMLVDAIDGTEFLDGVWLLGTTIPRWNDDQWKQSMNLILAVAAVVRACSSLC